MTRNLIAIALAALMLTACGKNDSARPTGAATGSTATVAAAGSLPAECDNYLKAYESCVSTKVPEAARAAMQETMSRTRSEWEKAVAQTSANRDALASACVQARESAKASLSAFGCTM